LDAGLLLSTIGANKLDFNEIKSERESYEYILLISGGQKTWQIKVMKR
jgi:hypothetical protein